ncbi:MAG: SAM-dependent methyltransferase [Gammaproteobacteria bacterium]|jgi:SAM-dependent methyltransferase
MTKISNNESGMFSVSQRLLHWFSGPLGQHLLNNEQAIFEKFLPDLFGYHLMQIGLLHGDKLIHSTRISHSFIIQQENEGEVQEGTAMQCSAEFLPIASESVDVVVLPHVLEYSSNPHKILREIERILIGDGHLIIVGFNPWSFFGIWRVLLAWRDEPPWCGHFFSYHRIRDWFTLLDFELVKLERSIYRPPFRNMKIMKKLEFLEKLGKFCWTIFGGIYVVVVRKRVVPLTPIKDIWLKRRSMIKSGIAEPTARSIDNT